MHTHIWAHTNMHFARKRNYAQTYSVFCWCDRINDDEIIHSPPEKNSFKQQDYFQCHWYQSQEFRSYFLSSDNASFSCKDRKLILNMEVWTTEHIKGVYVHLFPIGGDPAVGKGAHSNTGAQTWLTLPPFGPQFITYTAPQDWSLHGNDLEWSSQGLQLCDWWWERRGRGAHAHKRKKRHTHTLAHMALRWLWVIWQLHCGCCQSHPELMLPQSPPRLHALKPWSCLFSLV